MSGCKISCAIALLTAPQSQKRTALCHWRIAVGLVRMDYSAEVVQHADLCPAHVAREQRRQTAQTAVTLRGCAAFSPFQRCSVDYRPPRVCALLAPWKGKGSAATRHGWVFQSAPKQRPVTGDKMAVQRNGHFASPAQLREDRDALPEIRLVNCLGNAAPYPAHREPRPATSPSSHHRELGQERRQ